MNVTGKRPMLERIRDNVIGTVASAAIIAISLLIWQALTDGGLIRALNGITTQEMQAAEERLKTAEDGLQSTIDLLATKIGECRICFREIEGSSQCREGSRNTCSGWSSPDSNGAWTAWFRDDTDNRGGGCKYQWRLECR